MLIRAISISMWPVNTRTSSAVARPASAREKSASASAGESSAVNGVSAA